MSKNSIHELDLMSEEDSRIRARERIIEMYIEEGRPWSALRTLWKDVTAKQKGD